MTFAAKLLLIVTTAAAVPWGRFATVFFLNSGLSASNLGILRVIGLVGKVLAYPAWGVIADRTGDIRLTLLASVLLSGVSLVLFRSSTVLSSFTCLIFVKLLRSLLNAVWPLAEAMTLKIIAGTGEGYGKQRLWCAISWGLSSFVVGYCIDRFGITAIFAATWWLMVVECALILLFVPRPPSDVLARVKTEKSISTAEFLLRAKTVFMSRETSHFYFVTFVYGLVFALSEVVLMIAMEKDFHATKTLQGLAITASTVIEIPVFYYSDTLLKSYSVSKMLAIAHAAMMFRLLGYTLVPLSAPWILVVIQLCHGLCFSLMWVAAVSYASKHAPRGMEATAQTLLSNVWVLGNGLGAVAWTAMYDYVGSFRVVFLGGVFVLVLLMAWSHSCAEIDRISSKKDDDDDEEGVELLAA